MSVSTGTRIRAIREERGLTVREVARRTGLSRTTIWRLETDLTTAVPLRRLVAVALNVPAYTFDPEPLPQEVPQ